MAPCSVGTWRRARRLRNERVDTGLGRRPGVQEARTLPVLILSAQKLHKRRTGALVLCLL